MMILVERLKVWLTEECSSGSNIGVKKTAEIVRTFGRFCLF